jgi:hypothetical protein
MGSKWDIYGFIFCSKTHEYMDEPGRIETCSEAMRGAVLSIRIGLKRRPMFTKDVVCAHLPSTNDAPPW